MKHITIFGLHSVSAVLEKTPEHVLHMFIQKDRQDKKIAEIIKLANHYHLPLSFISRKKLDELANSNNHQGVIAACQETKNFSEKELLLFLKNLSVPPFILILDGVQDPHNLGACLRTAAAAGVHAVVAPKDKAVGLTSVVRKVASGAVELVPFVPVTNLARTMNAFKEHGIWIYGADANAPQTLYVKDLTGPLGIVLGAEGIGLRKLTRDYCDALLKIPMIGPMESLNISVAAGVFLFEALRQRGFVNC